MNTSSYVLHLLSWPALLLLAWVVGEILAARWRVPRVSSYVAVGLLAGLTKHPGLNFDPVGFSFLAHVALALMLFELGYRINLRWFRHNPWVLLVGVVESALTFALVFWASSWFGLSWDVGLFIAALSVLASPAGIVRVANELRSAGQVTERVVHLCAINCLVAVLLVKMVAGYWHFHTVDDLIQAGLGLLYALFIAVALGAVMGVLLAWLAPHCESRSEKVTVLFALAVLLLTTICFALQVSPLLAALSFGLVARERRLQLANAQRDFGSVGDLLTLFLFVYVATLIDWSQFWTTLGLALVLLGLRTASKVACNLVVARLSGVTWRKGVLTGLALTPMSAFAILLLEQSRQLGVETALAAFSVMAAMLVLQELFGPWVTQRSLMAAQESHAAPTNRP